jgi:hypothetical protein
MAMFEVGPQYVLDYEKFALSLEISQAAFLVVALQGSQNKKYYPLRLALEARIRDSPIKSGLGKLLMEEFYKPIGGGSTNGSNSGQDTGS